MLQYCKVQSRKLNKAEASIPGTHGAVCRRRTCCCRTCFLVCLKAEGADTARQCARGLPRPLIKEDTLPVVHSKPERRASKLCARREFGGCV